MDRDDERSNRIFSLFLIFIMIAFFVGVLAGSLLTAWINEIF